MSDKSPLVKKIKMEDKEKLVCTSMEAFLVDPLSLIPKPEYVDSTHIVEVLKCVLCAIVIYFKWLLRYNYVHVGC